MPLNDLQKQLLFELWVGEVARKEQLQQGSGHRWTFDALVLASAADRRTVLTELVDQERQKRVALKAERPSQVAQLDQQDDDAVALIDQAKTNL